MTDDDITGLDLPRRKLLGAIGAVGASSAGAGLGTSAYLNDTESFTGNSLTAGTLNLKLGGRVAATNSSAIDIETGSATIDGATSTAFFKLGDIKPGDLSILCLEITIVGNPAHLKINGSVVSDDNSVNEAEASAPNEGDELGTTGNDETGELALNTDIQAFGPNQNVDESSLTTILEDLEDGSFSSATTSSGSTTFATGQEVLMSDAFSKDGIDYVLTDTDGPRCFDPGTYRFYFALSVDKTVGNIIQSDSMDVDLRVEAVQCRHNDDTPFTDD